MTPLNIPPDPITITELGIWNVLEASPLFTSLVPEANRIKYTKDDTRKPDKEETRTADFPEIRLVPIRGITNYHASSTHTKFTKSWQLQMSTGDMRTTQFLNPVETAVICALMGWAPILQPLRFHTFPDPFIVLLEIEAATIGLRATQVDVKANIKGWASLLGVSVTIFIAFATLRDYASLVANTQNI